MHKKVISVFAAAMVLGGLLVVGTISPAAAQAPFGITNFHPTDDLDIDTFTGVVGYGLILSDRNDGVNTTTHLTSVATLDTDRVAWYACPAGTIGTTVNTQIELASCGTPIATDDAPTVPAGGSVGAPVDEAYDAEWNIPVDLDGFLVDIAALACTGAASSGTRVETTGGLSANCISDVETNVALEDAQNTQAGTTAATQTSSAEIVSYCTSDVVDGPLVGDNVCNLAGPGEGTDEEVAARFKPFLHGSSVPNNGFVFRVSTDSTHTTMSHALFAPSDASGISTTNSDGFDTCTLIVTTATSQTFECNVTAAEMTAGGLTNKEIMLVIDDFLDTDGSGYCDTMDDGGVPSHPGGADVPFCMNDAHYIVSGDRVATTTTFSFAPSEVQPGPTDGSPATNAGCTPGDTETPDNTEDQPIETDIWGTLCVVDQFLNPLSGKNVTFEQNTGPASSEIAGCATGVGEPARGDGDNHDEHGPTTTNDSRFDDCHTTLSATGEASVLLANYSTGTALSAAPGTQTFTGCVEREYLVPGSGGNQTNQPVGHGCTNEPAGAKATGTVHWIAIPDHVHTAIAGTGGDNPCHAGANVATREIGQNVDVTICTQILGPDPHVGATTAQPNGGRLKYVLVGSTGGQTELATNLLSQPTETDANGRATASLVCLRQGTDTLTVSLLDDTDTVLNTAFPIQISCVTPGEPTATGSPTTTTTATSTSTATSTVTTSPTGGVTPRTVSLEASKSKITFGREFALTGGVSSSVNACSSGVPVTIRRTIIGQSAQEVVENLTTNSDGTFSVNKVGDKSAQYIASVDDTAACAGAASSPAPVNVKVKVDLKLSSNKIRRGQSVVLKVKIAPCDSNHAGTKIAFLKSIGGSLGKFKSKNLNDSCAAKVKQSPRKSSVFQARYSKQDEDHDGGKSRKKNVRVSR